MKKILFIIAVLFTASALVNAQESQKSEPAKENTVKTVEPATPAATVEEKAKEAAIEKKVEEPKKEAVVKEAAKEVEKKAEAKPAVKASKESYMADLSGNDEKKIIAAADWLGEKEEKSAVPQLVNLLKNDKRTKVRLFATVALGQIGDESCIPALNEALLNDGNADVRYSVLLAIHRINPAKSLDALKKAKETDSDPYIKDYIEKMEAKWNEKK
ncbi:MAG: HEAT repeat domain-containing protein [Spirochaetota bacterium]